MIDNIPYAMGQGLGVLLSLIPLVIISVIFYFLLKRHKATMAIYGDRRYKTAFSIVKILEILSWIIVAIGGFISVSSGFMGLPLGLVVSVLGLLLVLSSQFALILIDTENNTRQTISELQKTNAMLAETLGTIANNVNKLATRERPEN